MDRDLPGFVVLTSKGGRNPQPIAARQWSNGFLPGRFQGVQFHAQGDPVHYVQNPPGVTDGGQRGVVDAVTALDAMRAERTRDPRIASRIAQYELAFRMQASVPELMDVAGESQETLDLYGAKPGDGSFASNCLLARRLAERGVRFIQLYHRGWDHHGGLKQVHGRLLSVSVTSPTAALLHRPQETRHARRHARSSGAVNSAARRCRRAGVTIPDATTTSRDSRCSSPAAAIKWR